MSQDMIRDLRDSVAAGAYASPSKIVRDAVRLWRERRREDADIIEGIRARIRQSLDDPRPNMSLEEVEARVSDLYARAKVSERDAAPQRSIPAFGD